MDRETVTLSKREWQRVGVISQCVQGNLACARAAELLDLSPRHVKRLKARYRQGGAAALAHASRARPSHRRLSGPGRAGVLTLAPTAPPHSLRGLKPPSSSAEAGRERSFLAQPRNPSPTAARRRHRSASHPPSPGSSPAPTALRPRRRTRAT